MSRTLEELNRIFAEEGGCCPGCRFGAEYTEAVKTEEQKQWNKSCPVERFLGKLHGRFADKDLWWAANPREINELIAELRRWRDVSQEDSFRAGFAQGKAQGVDESFWKKECDKAIARELKWTERAEKAEQDARELGELCDRYYEHALRLRIRIKELAHDLKEMTLNNAMWYELHEAAVDRLAKVQWEYEDQGRRINHLRQMALEGVRWHREFDKLASLMHEQIAKVVKQGAEDIEKARQEGYHEGYEEGSALWG